MDQLVIVDATLPSKLSTFTEPVELCDPSGQLLGRFIPADKPARYGPLEPQVSEEELDRREQEEDSYTTAEVLAYLESLQCSTPSDGNGPLGTS